MLEKISFYYGSSSCIRDISSDARPLVLGVGPGAIDVARTARCAGITEVIMASRNGRISKVQPCNRDFSMETEVESRIRFLESSARLKGGTISLDHILNEFADLFNFVAPDFSWERFFSSPHDAVRELEDDIAHAKSGGTNWQKIMLPLGIRSSRIWKLLPDKDRLRFKEDYESSWMVYRHAMPIKTAEEVLTMLKTGFLRVGALIDKPKMTKSGFSIPLLMRPGGPQLIEASHIVIATGPNYQCTAESENVLISHIVKSRFAEAHPFGGFRLEPNTLRLNGRPRVYCIGAMTRGEEFYVNAMPVLVQQAVEIVRDLFRRLHSQVDLHAQNEIEAGLYAS